MRKYSPMRHERIEVRRMVYLGHWIWRLGKIIHASARLYPWKL
jgi:hypothetical protein